jgi:hypothetical protein
MQARRRADDDNVDIRAFHELVVRAAGDVDPVPRCGDTQPLLVDVAQGDDPRTVRELEQRARVLLEDATRAHDADAQLAHRALPAWLNRRSTGA